MLPSEVTVTNVKDSVEFDLRGSPVTYQQYTFFIGDHGPFIEKFYAGEQDSPAVERRISDRVLLLRSLGVLPQV
jgi:hypothetical protein